MITWSEAHSMAIDRLVGTGPSSLRYQARARARIEQGAHPEIYPRMVRERFSNMFMERDKEALEWRRQFQKALGVDHEHLKHATMSMEVAHEDARVDRMREHAQQLVDKRGGKG